jgi:hypothetical protein
LSRRQTAGQQEFVLEIGGRPVLALMSRDIEGAGELCSQAWFVEELASYRSRGEPIWDGTAALRVRRADAREATDLRVALGLERARKEYEGYVFAFLMPIDAMPQ